MDLTDVRLDDRLIFREKTSSRLLDGWVNEFVDTHEGPYIKLSGSWYACDDVIVLKHYKNNALTEE